MRSWNFAPSIVALAVFLPLIPIRAGADETKVSAAMTEFPNRIPAMGGSSLGSSISADGQLVAFESDATNLVEGDTNSMRDIFVYNRRTRVTRRVSVASDGSQANGFSVHPRISANGRFVVFASTSSNLIPGDTEDNTYDIFMHDLHTRITTQVNVTFNGAPTSYHPGRMFISANGRYVVFNSTDPNLVAHDTNNATDVFLRDHLMGTTTRLSVSAHGAQANGGSHTPYISPNGRFVIFSSDASNLVPGDRNGAADYFVRDLWMGTMSRVSIGLNGATPNGELYESQVDDQGRFVVFGSTATNLVANDTSDLPEVFVHDRQTGVTLRPGEEHTGVSFDVSINAHGRFVTFFSAKPATDNIAQIFVYDLQAAVLSLVSVNTEGMPADDNAIRPFISSDGRYVTFDTFATNLVSGDTNEESDVFVHDRETGSTTLASVGNVRIR